MDANQSLYIVCRNGVFILPEHVCKALGALITNGFVYLRQDDEVLTISATRIEGGHRRVLSGRFRAPMFRAAKKLAIVNYNDSLRVMAIS
jgi:hypothetical protein